MKVRKRVVDALCLLFVLAPLAYGQEGEGLAGPPLASRYGLALAAGAHREAPAGSLDRLDLSGVWMASEGSIVFEGRTEKGEAHAYMARVTQDAGEQLFTASFDGQTLRLRRAEAKPASGTQLGITQRLGAAKSDPRIDEVEAKDPEEVEGVYIFSNRNSGPEVLSASTRVNAEGTTPFFELRRSLDSILHLGLSVGASAEVQNLLATGAAVVAIANSPEGVRRGDRIYALDNDAEVREFVETLGLSLAQETAVQAVLLRAEVSALARDELGQLAAVWSAAERGEALPSRMVISGHHVADSVWGAGGLLEWSALKELASALPRAAAQVEDLHVAACNTGGYYKLTLFAKIFPNLRTLWAYVESAPGAVSGATAHQRYWERGTRGAKTEVRVEAQKLIKDGSRKARNIYAVVVGDEDQPTEPLAWLLGAIYGSAQQGIYSSHDRGLEVGDSQTGSLRTHYNLVQRALRRPELATSQPLMTRRDRTIRLLYYVTHVAPRFASEYRDELKAGYAEISRPVPRFGALSRKDALAEIGMALELLGSASGSNGPASRLRDLLEGLEGLDSVVIPENWL